MPAFCRHNRLIANCPICTREQGTEMNPVVSSSTPRISEPRERVAREPADRLGSRQKSPQGSASGSRGRGGRGSAGGGVKVRRLERGADDGYGSALLPGLRSSKEAERLADELSFATARIELIGTDPPATLAAVADTGADLEERTWAALAFELDPDGDVDDRASWTSGEGAPAYRAWAERVGSQAAAIAGESFWSPARRFERAFERLGAQGGLDRAERYDLLVILGALGLYELEAAKLFPSGENETTWAAKRALGIGDPLLLERRADELAAACGVPLAALDLALANWNAGAAGRSGRGVPADLEPDPERVAGVRRALGL